MSVQHIFTTNFLTIKKLFSFSYHKNKTSKRTKFILCHISHNNITLRQFYPRTIVINLGNYLLKMWYLGHILLVYIYSYQYLWIAFQFSIFAAVKIASFCDNRFFLIHYDYVLYIVVYTLFLKFSCPILFYFQYYFQCFR